MSWKLPKLSTPPRGSSAAGLELLGLVWAAGADL
jgi:hypothetical protein